MNLVKMGFLAYGLATWLALTPSVAMGQTPPSPTPFQVFDGTLYRNKPDLSAFGIRPITLVYQEQLGSNWYNYPDRLPDIQAVQSVARKAQLNRHPVVLDIEHWPLTGSADIIQESLRKYMTVLKWFREAAPGLPVGYYGRPPVHDYGRAILDAATQQRQAWMAENDEIRSLAGAVDIHFPSLYTFHPDQADWKKHAIAQIGEARRYGNGKPVYVFLWPQFHQWNTSLGGTYLPPDFWLLQLETARTYADGIVLWAGSSEWNENAPWWIATKQFLKRSDVKPPAAPTSLTIR